MKIRQIVKDALKCNELDYQFRIIDVADRHLVDGSREEITKEINEKYDDAHIIKEAEYRLDICMDLYNQEEADWRCDAKQLRKFLAKYK